MRAVYVSIHRQQYLIEHQLSELFDLSILRLLHLPKKFRIFTNLPLRTIKILSSRYSGTDNMRTKYRSSAIWELFILSRQSSISRLKVPSHTILRRIFKKLLSNLINKQNLAIIPSDIWDLVEQGLRSKTFLEVRWITQEFIDSLAIPDLPYISNTTTQSKNITPANCGDWADFAGFITYSEVAKNSLAYLGIPREKIFVNPLTDISSLSSGNNSITNSGNDFLYIGRPAPEKRLDIAVKIAQRMQISIKVVGKFDETTTRWLIDQPFVDLVGTIPHGDLLDLMKESFALLSTGIESYGLAIIEALEQGTKVYATKYVGVTEWISHPKLYVVDEMSTDLFVREISKESENIRTARTFDASIWARSLESFLSSRLLSESNNCL